MAMRTHTSTGVVGVADLSRDLTPSGGGATLGTRMVVVLLLHCAKHCPEIVGVRYYVAYSTYVDCGGVTKVKV